MNNKMTIPNSIRRLKVITPWAVLAISLIIPVAGAVAAVLLVATLFFWPTRMWLKIVFSGLAIVNATVANLHILGGPIPLPSEIIVVNAITIFLGAATHFFLSRSRDYSKATA